MTAAPVLALTGHRGLPRGAPARIAQQLERKPPVECPLTMPQAESRSCWGAFRVPPVLVYDIYHARSLRLTSR